MNKTLLAGILGALAVGLGAFGAHGLKELLAPEQLEIFKTGVHYHLIHTVVLLSLGLYLSMNNNKRLTIAYWLILLGILLFSGSLYLLSTRSVLGLTNWKWLGPITPLGGLSFIVAWLLIAVSGLGTKQNDSSLTN